MKTFYGFLVIFAMSVIYSCSKSDMLSNPQESISLEKTHDNVVSLDDIHSILVREFPQSKNSIASDFQIAPYICEEKDTLMYIVNLNEGQGWRIYSSDKRTPPILAKGDKGYFSLEEGSPAVAVWLSRLANDISIVRSLPDSQLKFNEEEINANMSFWPSGEGQGVSTLRVDLPPPQQLILKGHWEVSVSTSIVERDTVNHMVAKWSQDGAYNAMSPFYADNSGKRAYAGCVAIAGAQVLHYLHDKLGIPETMYSSGSCTGDIHNYTREFSNPSSTVWSQMSVENRRGHSFLPESILIGYVGERVGMHYCDNVFDKYSWALPRNLKDKLFEYHGIACTHGVYDEDAVERSLLDHMPVIVSASDMAIPVDGDIHCFVIDGYRATHTQYAYHHYFVLDEIPSGIYALPDEYMTYSYASPQVAEIKINWGWRNQWQNDPVNDGWYALTSGWYVDVNGEHFNYDRNIKIIYGFTEL